jgi:hypothetical protein
MRRLTGTTLMLVAALAGLVGATACGLVTAPRQRCFFDTTQLQPSVDKESGPARVTVAAALITQKCVRE